MLNVNYFHEDVKRRTDCGNLVVILRDILCVPC